HHLILAKRDFNLAETYISKALALTDQTEHALRAELWFYRYAHYDKWLEKGAEELKELIAMGAKSVGWNFQAHLDIAEQNHHSALKELTKFTHLLGA
ncbi:MAG: hypothetical protein AAF985_21350, partial [Bacteroidota bacterium]